MNSRGNRPDGDIWTTWLSALTRRKLYTEHEIATWTVHTFLNPCPRQLLSYSTFVDRSQEKKSVKICSRFKKKNYFNLASSGSGSSVTILKSTVFPAIFGDKIWTSSNRFKFLTPKMNIFSERKLRRHLLRDCKRKPPIDKTTNFIDKMLHCFLSRKHEAKVVLRLFSPAKVCIPAFEFSFSVQLNTVHQCVHVNQQYLRSVLCHVECRFVRRNSHHMRTGCWNSNTPDLCRTKYSRSFFRKQLSRVFLPGSQ